MKHFKSVKPGYICYYLNVHLLSVVNKIRYRFKGLTVIYAIRCRVTGMMYIGSTFSPSLRFHQHLMTGSSSNINLQTAIARYGQSKFVVYILEVVEMPKQLTYGERKNFLAEREQHYMNHYPIDQLYNTIRAIAT